ncbi:hypothetical protein C4561_04565 [candidate division WWE3 bacterium]|jgi:cytoskeletal protein RodZ|uniref:Uncharacterized protein n=1 Tax=candidate division WWE3 bacterium TaxID=2053526 RepID=A0A3A4ZK19_UNCKA|nr:MAG: hypothetical protein C4561_04565 [candidate division WWE3 bacterium]
MNEETQPQEKQNGINMQMPKTPADKSNLYWAIALLAMALFFAFGVLLTYLGLTKKFIFNEPLDKTTNENNVKYLDDPTMRNDSVKEEDSMMNDENKDPETVTDELLEEIDEIESTDVEGAYDVRPLDEVAQ